MKKGQDIAVKFPGLYLVHQNLPGKSAASHQHPTEHILFIPLSGEITIHLENELLKAGPGKMIYLPPGVQHSFNSSEISGERLIALIEKRKFKIQGTPKVLSASQLIKELLFYLLLNQKTKAALALIQTLCETLSEGMEGGETCLELNHLEGSTENRQLQRAIQFISENYSEDISILRISKSAGLSTRSLNRAFSNELAISPKQLITQFRMKRAVELLSTQKKSVTEVAFEVGYNSLSQFIASFRAYTGQLPSEFKSYKK